MIITKIEPVTKSRCQIYLDGQPAFCLYKGEVSRYGLAEDQDLTEEAYQQICRETLLKRAKLRAMHLLNQMGRTERQLREKLVGGGYPEEVAEEALSYVKSFGYINDLEYARNFILGRKNKKSRREICAALREKGVDGEVIEEALEECLSQEDHLQAIRELLRKRHYDPETADRKKTAKELAYLMRKGFRYEDIRQVIQVSEWNA
nr:regulatory protein RecX [uncultured Merdimonas sp.]